jgi:hypothetical protein
MSSDAPKTYGRISTEPVFTLGGPEVTGPAQFSNIRSVIVDAGRNLWVADGASNQVRVFRADGAHVKTFGRIGDGPGEFRRIRLLGHFATDSVAVWDDATSRLTVYSPSGEVARTVSTWSGEDLQPRAFGIFGDGTVLIVEARLLSADSLVPGTAWQDTLRLMRLNATAATRDELALVPGVSWVWNGRAQLALPFSASASYVVREDEVHIVSGPDFRIQVSSEELPGRIYGVERPRRPITTESREAWLARLGEDSIQRREQRALLGHPLLPGFLPAYVQVLSSDTGEIWARLHSLDPFAAATWDVYSRDGLWLGQIQAPASFFAHAISGDRLIGVWYDALGVEYVRAYAIERDPSTTG